MSKENRRIANVDQARLMAYEGHWQRSEAARLSQEAKTRGVIGRLLARDRASDYRRAAEKAEAAVGERFQRVEEAKASEEVQTFFTRIAERSKDQGYEQVAQYAEEFLDMPTEEVLSRYSELVHGKEPEEVAGRTLYELALISIEPKRKQRIWLAEGARNNHYNPMVAAMSDAGYASQAKPADPENARLFAAYEATVRALGAAPEISSIPYSMSSIMRAAKKHQQVVPVEDLGLNLQLELSGPGERSSAGDAVYVAPALKATIAPLNVPIPAPN